MDDLSRPLGDPQDQVPVLGALEPGSKPPTSSTRLRRRTLKWQVYICVRIRSGDQSGLQNGAECIPARLILSSSV